MNQKEQFGATHRRGAPVGNRNAWKHGWYSSEAIRYRRALAQLLQDTLDVIQAMRAVRSASESLSALESLTRLNRVPGPADHLALEGLDPEDAA
jgi:hypothetical protein